MAKRGEPSALTSEPLAELGPKYAANEKAAIRALLDSWSPVLKAKLKPADLRLICEYLSAHPYSIGGDYAPYVYLILQELRVRIPPPRRHRVGQRVAELVDLVITIEGITPNKAYQKVADTLGKEFDTVKRHHQRYGKVKRAKSR